MISEKKATVVVKDLSQVGHLSQVGLVLDLSQDVNQPKVGHQQQT